MILKYRQTILFTPKNLENKGKTPESVELPAFCKNGEDGIRTRAIPQKTLNFQYPTEVRVASRVASLLL